MRNTQPSCEAASYTVKMLVPKQRETRERCTIKSRAEFVIETNVIISVLLNTGMSERLRLIQFYMDPLCLSNGEYLQFLFLSVTNKHSESNRTKNTEPPSLLVPVCVVTRLWIFTSWQIHWSDELLFIACLCHCHWQIWSNEAGKYMKAKWKVSESAKLQESNSWQFFG